MWLTQLMKYIPPGYHFQKKTASVLPFTVATISGYSQLGVGQQRYMGLPLLAGI